MIAYEVIISKVLIFEFAFLNFKFNRQVVPIISPPSDKSYGLIVGKNFILKTGARILHTHTLINKKLKTQLNHILTSQTYRNPPNNPFYT
jgi:hypothetical protein